MKNKFYLLLLLLCSYVGSRANTYYWVGGSGDFTQVAHWSKTSGNSGGVLWGVTPGQTDDVIFDANSGFTTASRTVTTSTVINVQSMTWTGVVNNPVFNANNKTVTIYGNLTLTTGMSISSLANLTFSSNNTDPANKPTQTITSNGLAIPVSSQILFDGLANWSQQDALTITGNSYFTFKQGVYSTNNYNFTIPYLTTDGSGATGATLNLGSSSVLITNFLTQYGNYGAINTTAANFTINAGTSIINTSNGGSIFVKNGDAFYDVIYPANARTQQLSNSGSATFHSFVFSGNTAGSISGNNTFGSLTLGINTYTFGNGSTQTVTNTFTTAGATCLTPTVLTSDSKTVQANLVLPGGTSVTNFVIQGINASPGTATANSSLDLGNNSGWAFTTGSINTLYWIGGTGNWNDPAHWSYTSGGTAANCVPSAYTDVYIDAASGFTAGSKTITLTGPSFSRNQTWAGSTIAPTLNANNQTMSIYGSWTLQSGMSISNAFNALSFGSFATAGSPEVLSITTNGVTVPMVGAQAGGGNNSIRLAGYATWNLMSDFTETSYAYYKDDNIDLAYGTLNTNNYTVTAAGFSSETVLGNPAASLNLGASTWIMIGPVFNTNWTNLSFNAGTSTIRFPSTYNSLASPQVYAKSGGAYWNVEQNNSAYTLYLGSGGTATFKSVIISGNAYFGYGGGNMTFANTTFAQSYNYTFLGGSTQTFTNTFTGFAGCTTLGTFTSSSGTQATIVIPSTINSTGLADLGGQLVTGIKKTGTGTLNASSSIDNGNNTGIAFPTGNSTPRYWVGGTGNWSDASHWSYTSGGVGGACVPLPTNDVYFDANSFTAAGQTVTMDANSQYCGSMYWAGINTTYLPTFNTNTKTLNVYGNLEWMAGMTVSGNFALRLNTLNTNSASYANYTITSHGVTISPYNTILNGYANWSLADDYTETANAFSGTGGIYITMGVLNTNNNNITTSELNIVGTANGNGVLNAGTSTIKLIGNYYGGNFNSNYTNGVFNGVNTTLLGSSVGGFMNSGTAITLKSGNSVSLINFTSGAGTVSGTGATVGSINYGSTTATGTLNLTNGTVSSAVFNGPASINSPGSTITTASLTNDGALQSNNTTYGTLNLSPGRTYTFTSGNTTNVTTRLRANGNPCNPITITTTGTTAATINYTGSPKMVGYAKIAKIRVLPAGASGTLAADNNSTDNGGNTNITFDNSGSQIIGLGPSSLGLNCGAYPYTQNTTLFYADTAATYKWYNRTTDPNSTTVIATTPSLNIAGAGKYAVEVTYGAGVVSCVVPDDITITTSSNTLTPVLAANSTAIATIASTCTDGSYIQFRDPSNGLNKYVAINPNGNTGYNFSVRAINNSPFINNQRKTDGMSSTTALGNRMFSVADAGTNNYTVNGGMIVRIYIAAGDESAAAANLDPAVTGTYGYRYFKFPGTSVSDIMNAQTNTGLIGAVFLTPSTTGTENGVSYVEFSGIQSFSTFGALANRSNVILPLSLTDFTATRQAATSLLSWKVAQEQNISTYTIERSADGRSFMAVGSVASLGNTSTVRGYSFTDAQPLKGINYYRLKITEKDGKMSYAPVRLLNFDTQISIAIYPNPVKDYTTITGVNAGMTLRLINAVGQQVGVQKAIGNLVNLSMSQLATGIYQLQVVNDNGLLLSTTKIIKQ